MSEAIRLATGLERIAQAFERSDGKTALMPYLMGGFPTVEVSRQIAFAYVDAGADLIELGVPFSDPLADGPVIHRAATAALAAGAKVDDVLGIAAAIGDRVPVLLMAYANTISRRGAAKFVADSVAAGVAGLIVPDLPAEEATSLRGVCREAGVALIPLVAPTTTDERLARIGAEADGFVYTVAVTGTTGERADAGEGLADLVARVRRATGVPVAVGFGIGDERQAARVAEFADGAIIGSRLVREVASCVASGDDPVPAIRELTARFAAAIA